MPNPKHKFSKQRRNTRRAHDFIEGKTIAICPNTKTAHLYHRGYVVEGNLYYKGKMVVEGFEKVKVAKSE